MKAPTFIVCALIAGCSTLGGPKQTTGTLVGGGLGALAGSQIGDGNGQIAAVAIGTLLGALVGGEIGAGLDAQDRQMATNTFHSAASRPVGTTVNWNNPRTDHGGSFKTTRDGQANDGRYCREYITEVYYDGKVERSSGVACRSSNGAWRFL